MTDYAVGDRVFFRRRPETVVRVNVNDVLLKENQDNDPPLVHTVKKDNPNLRKSGDITCPHCGYDEFQEYGTVSYTDRVTVERKDDKVLATPVPDGEQEIIYEEQESKGVECANCCEPFDAELQEYPVDAI